jgi:hypothetical protein
MAPKSDAGRMALLVMMVTAALAVAAGLLVYLNREPDAKLHRSLGIACDNILAMEIAVRDASDALNVADGRRG